MKQVIVLFSFIMIGLTAHADQRQEKAINELEAKSASLRIDASTHINSIEQKYAALPKAVNGMANSDAFFSTTKGINQKTYEMLSAALSLKSETNALMEQGRKDPLLYLGSTDGRIAPSTRLSVAWRDISCTEFSLGLMTDNPLQFKEALSLANSVLKSCKSINDADLGITHSVDSIEAPLNTKPVIKKKK